MRSKTCAEPQRAHLFFGLLSPSRGGIGRPLSLVSLISRVFRWHRTLMNGAANTLCHVNTVCHLFSFDLKGKCLQSSEKDMALIAAASIPLRERTFEKKVGLSKWNVLVDHNTWRLSMNSCRQVNNMSICNLYGQDNLCPSVASTSCGSIFADRRTRDVRCW